MRLKVTNTQTGKVFEDENESHSWEELCFDAGLDDKLVYCDLEGLVFLNGDWLLLDECGSWATLPDHYKVEEVK